MHPPPPPSPPGGPPPGAGGWTGYGAPPPLPPPGSHPIPGLAVPYRPARRPGRTVRNVLGTVGAVVVTWFCAVTGWAMAAPDVMTGAGLAVEVLWFFVAGGVATAMVWRQRYPVVVCLATAVVGIVSPLGAVAPLIALPWVVARTDWRRSLLCGAATAAALVATFWRDGSRTAENVIFSATLEDGGPTTYMSPLGYTILGALALGLAVGVGLLRRLATRADADADAARAVAAAEAGRAATWQQQSQSLQTELTRQEERELIAREMHDTVAHQLSLMSLQASVLEVSSDDGEVGDAARSMRASAHHALEEMRTLITSLREGADDYGARSWSLDDLGDLLESARERGVDLVATVFVSDGDDAPATLTRTVYRVVQESLTNATKHAPGTRVAVQVRARPRDGIDITVRNPPASALTPDAVPGSGAGIVGMRERCEALDGSFDAGWQDDGTFLVRAHLPWVPAP
ncbi:signal transduction histidine kinase [Isoptericola sp. CG 20/1183]|uniref:histidine kinase n=1 Tax=Isoptericola halotolerans TaxID=300560 RepID=A0ABX5EGI0_9MICO|nr:MULTISPECIES: histidine kinase [Isoptericola]PRZ08605.1 signal transduction histidine kinase [Isoptericola halotolerans]PRZ10948.1 signal transduction histidine kinase [Isoptericola sp. CG 20/1183]